MRRLSLRETTLFSLLGLSSKSSSSSTTTTTTTTTASATPSASLAHMTSFSPSTETLVPTPSPSSSPSDTTAAPTLPTSDFSFTVSLEQPTQRPTTVARTTAGERFHGTGSITAGVYLGDAVPPGYRKIGLAGALAGAAGVFMV